MRLLLDAMYSVVIAEQLRRRGHDVIAAKEDRRLANMKDADLFASAQADGRAVVTENHKDFLDIDEQYRQLGLEHHGLIMTSNSRIRRGTEGHIGQLVRELDAFLAEDAERAPGWIHWLR